MTGALRKRILCALTLLLATAGLWMAPAAAWAQWSGLPPEPGPQFPSEPFQTPLPIPQLQASGVGASIGDRCSPDYWIASTRCCEQRWGKGCWPSCNFDYFRRASDRILRPSDARTFHESLVPNVPVCIMVHGSFVAWEDVLIDSERTFGWIRDAAPNLPVHVIFFTWPSEGYFTGVAQIDVGILGARSGRNGMYLAQLVQQLEGEHPICIIGHSHGARTTISALHALGGGAIEGKALNQQYTGQRRIRAVLAAAAVDHNWLNPGKRYGNALCSAECLVNLRNRHDMPLSLYPLRIPFGRPALARKGFTEKDYRQQGWLGSKTVEMDVTQLIQSGHMWPNYYCHPEIACALVPYIYFNDTYVEQAVPTEMPEVLAH